MVGDDCYKGMGYGRKGMREGYMCSERGGRVGVGMENEEGYVRMKGGWEVWGMSGYEWEDGVCLEEGEELMKLWEGGMIEKSGYVVGWGREVFEVDEL